MTFLLANLTKETLFQPRSRNEKLTALFIGSRWVQNYEEHFRRPEGDNFRTQIDVNTFLKEVTRRDSSIA